MKVSVLVGIGLLITSAIVAGVMIKDAVPDEKGKEQTPTTNTDTAPDGFNKDQVPLSSGFDLPIGDKTFCSEKKDGDGWYNAQDFRRNLHLGEDWNLETGGNTDCGQKVYAASEGLVVYSGNVPDGWGNVMIIRHKLPDGSLVETEYGHLKERHKEVGETVTRRELIGLVGDGKDPCGDNELYYAHLHFELRLEGCRSFGQVGGGYSEDAEGWTDPSAFIKTHRKL